MDLYICSKIASILKLSHDVLEGCWVNQLFLSDFAIMESNSTTAALLRWGFSLLHSSKAFKGIKVPIK